MKILITGAAGFIGSHLARALVQEHQVTGIDNFDPYYDRQIKENNLASLREKGNFRFVEMDLLDDKAMDELFTTTYDLIVHLAAKAGVRPSIENPVAYTKHNVEATVKLFDRAVKRGIKDIVFASSSSVYGNNKKVPFSESDNVDFPISPYAATKKSCELLTHSFAKLHGMRVAAMRFFTVYGPGQRPDLAISKFTGMIHRGEAIPFFGDGTTERDYTYIDDIVQGLLGVTEWLQKQPQGTWDVFNLGESQTTKLKDLVALIEEAVGKKAVINKLPMQPGDVQRTYADITKSRETFGYNPQVKIKEGIPLFVKYYLENHKG